MISPAIILTRPSALLWALAAAVVVLLYMRSMRPPRVTVGRPYLWQQVLGEPRSAEATWSRRRLVSATIHVTVVLLFALAAADPCLRRPRTVAYVVDNSASMKAVEAGNERLAEAIAMLRRHLEGIGPREFAALVSTAGEPVILCPAEQNRDRVALAVDRIRAADRPSRLAAALDVARGLAVPGTRLEIHVFSDGCFQMAEATDYGAEVILHPVGTAAGNGAVTRVALRRYPGAAGRFQSIAEVTNRSDVRLNALLRVLLEGETIHESRCEVDANSTASSIIELESESGGRLAVILDSPDSLAQDNRLEIVLPEPATAAGDAGDRFPESRMVVQAACDTRSPPEWVGQVSEVGGYGVGPLWPWAVLLAFVLLFVEWALFHRRWTS